MPSPVREPPRWRSLALPGDADLCQSSHPERSMLSKGKEGSVALFDQMAAQAHPELPLAAAQGIVAIITLIVNIPHSFPYRLASIERTEPARDRQDSDRCG